MREAQPDSSELRILIGRDRIQARVAELGRQIRVDSGAGPILLIAILKGAAIFFADLARAIPGPVRFDFMGVSSYGRETVSSGEVKITKDLDTPIEGLDIVLVEDIVDTGITLGHVTRLLKARRPRSLRVAALLDKPSRRLAPVHIDYAGFTIPNEFVVGYGLDSDELFRNLSDIAVAGE